MKLTIGAARKNCELTQKELGEKIGVSKYTIMNWEKGKSAPNIPMFRKMCAVLGVSVDDIILPQKST